MATKRASPRNILQRNLTKLMTANKMSGPEVAELAKVDRKTINNMLNAEYDPRPEKVDAVAQVFGLSGWQLLRPLPDSGTPPKGADELLEFFYGASEEDREKILGVAEMAAKYNRR